MRDYEKRNVVVKFNVSADEEMRVSGTAIPYEVSTDTGWGIVETIKRGASTEALRSNNQYMLWQHRSEYPLASVQSNTLILTEDERGVHFICDLSKSGESGKQVFELVKNDIVNQVSFAFSVSKENESIRKEGDIYYRDIYKFNILREISPVVWAAYPTTHIEKEEILQRCKKLVEENDKVDLDVFKRQHLNYIYRQNQLFLLGRNKKTRRII